VTRDELIARTRQLVGEGVRLQANPSLDALRTWLQLSDDLLSTAWGSMDRYHLSWLQVGRPTSIVRGRPMREDEEIAYVREVAAAKTAVHRLKGQLREIVTRHIGQTAATEEEFQEELSEFLSILSESSKDGANTLTLS